VYYTVHVRDTLWESRIGAGEATKLGNFTVKQSEFALGKDGIYFFDLTERAPGATLKFLDLHSRAVTALTQITRRPAQGLALSPDGRTLLWSQVERDSSDLLFADHVR
jgi:hypothetical protein